MKNRMLIVGIIVIIFIVLGVIIIKPLIVKKRVAAKSSAAQKAEAAKAKPTAVTLAKKVISKDRGGLTIKILDSKNKDMAITVRAFKSADSKSSVFEASFVSSRMAELVPGTYDIEINTVPQKIYKNISVSEGKENIEDLGNVTGSLNVKALNSKKKNAAYPINILYPKSNVRTATTSTNRSFEIVAGTYDLEIGTLPKQARKDVKIEAGKEIVVDLGAPCGALVVKTIDENKKEARAIVKIIKSETGEAVTSSSTGRTMELLAGTYDVEMLSGQKQVKKGIKVNAGEETGVEFTVLATTPLAPKKAPAVKQAAPSATVKPAPSSTAQKT